MPKFDIYFMIFGPDTISSRKMKFFNDKSMGKDKHNKYFVSQNL